MINYYAHKIMTKHNLLVKMKNKLAGKHLT